jgi:hypothetical protein
MLLTLACSATMIGCQSPASRAQENKQKARSSELADALMMSLVAAIAQSATRPAVEPTGVYSLRIDAQGRPVLIVKGDTTSQAYLIDISARSAMPTTLPVD